MKKNRFIISLWIFIITLIILSMVIYVIYAAINNPYFGNAESKNLELIINKII